MKEQFLVEWVDSGHEPQQVPDLRYPDGIHLDVSKGAQSCQAFLPYPARRCGFFYVECKKCGVNAVVSTAGRIDDPRSIRLPCKKD
jgi:hypothetical protein